LIYYAINLFRIRKYIIVCTDKYIIAIPNEYDIECFTTKAKAFETITLFNSLIIQNSEILKKGASYAD
jgi:hypothetical protein